MVKETNDTITPEFFSSAVFTGSKENGITLLEAIAESCEELQIHEEDVKQYLTDELMAHLNAECLNGNMLKERQTTARIF